MNDYSWGLDTDDYIAHFGRKGMHWGERLYQYKDGTYTPAGLLRYFGGTAKKRASDAAKVAKSAATGAALEAAGRGSQKLVDNYRYNDGSNAKTSVGKKIGNKLHSLANDRRVKTLAESQSDVDAFKRNHGGQGPRLRDSLEYRNSAMNARQNAKLFRDEAIRQSAKRDVAKAYGDTERYNEAVSLTKQCLSTAIGQEHRYSQLTGGSMVVENAYDY